MARSQTVTLDLIKPHQVVPRIWFQESGIRHTIVVCVVTPNNEILLVRPTLGDAHGWILPQGEINQGESLTKAATRELQEELGWRPSACDWSCTQYLGWYDHYVEREAVTKRLYGLVVQVKRWHKPRLNDENRSFVRAGGPNHLWHLIPGCSPGKRLAMVCFIEVAVQKKVLRGFRWHLDRLQPVKQLACS